jgi:PKHD-type hydroxylase
MLITEPRWKNLIVKTAAPIFTPEQCQSIINVGKSEPKEKGKIYDDFDTVDINIRNSHISWIPFKKLPQMYEILNNVMQRVNKNNFGFEGMQITEVAQYTEYSEGGFYDWHTDTDIDGLQEPPVRKISMSCILSQNNQFEGGELEFISKGKNIPIEQGQAVFFASFIRHRVLPVTKGVRKSLVMWFGGPSFK